MQEACASVSGLAELCRELGYDTARSVPGYFRVETAPTRPSSWVAPQPNRAASSLATQAALTQCQGELRSAHKELQVARALLHRYESSRFIQLAMRLKALGRGSPAATGAGPKGVR
jgi:hypothetical protein